jgi:hypothetical protein
MRTWNKSMLTLGAAVAVSGLVAAAPARAAMTGAPCGGTKASKSGEPMQQGTKSAGASGNGMAQGMKAGMSGQCGGKCGGKSGNPCGGKN